MRKLILQMQMSVDGFVGSDEDRRWQLWEWGDDSAWDEQLKHYKRKTAKEGEA